MIVPTLANPMASMIFKFIDNGELNELLELFNTKQAACPVINIKDVRGYSLLTFCALKNDILALKIIYEHVMSTSEDKGDPSVI